MSDTPDATAANEPSGVDPATVVSADQPPASAALPGLLPSLGRIVHYVLSADDVDAIDRLMPIVVDGQRQPRNPVAVGDMYPAMVVKVFGAPYANLQVFLDGACTYWATSRGEGDQPATWSWPARS